jgi:hypothetical protein
MAPGLPALLALDELKIEPVTLPPEAHSPGLRLFVLANHLRAADQHVADARRGLIQARQLLDEAEKNAAVAVSLPKTRAPESLAPPPVFQYNFAGPNPEGWEVGPGQWRYEKGKLVQQAENEVRSSLRARKEPPADFQATFKFAITGGVPWRSVGLSFDGAGDNEVLVYASAYEGGPKVQIAYKQAGQYAYPADGAQARSIRLHETLELALRVRGPLLNVAINGEHVLAYRLPLPRRAGRLELVTYAASAEFQAFELAALPANVALIERSAKGVSRQSKRMTSAQARIAVVLAEKTLAAAQAQPTALRARAAADRARWLGNPGKPASFHDLAVLAAKAEARLAVARADESLARAELDLARAEPAHQAAAEKTRNAARAVLDQARKTLDKPSEQYTPLPGALKTFESNLETEAARAKPFPTTSTGRRSALARWLTDVRNPLTARVAVNHVWARHFGKPLVATVFDLGRKGARPTHPELLDYLAGDLVEHGWSLKRLHRLLVTSQAYRLSSSAVGARAATLAVDPENRWYWRMNATRMEAEVIRDSLLHLAAALNSALGGPTLDPAQQEASRRRSLYFVHSHNDHHKFLTMFDEASVLECYRRAESIVPQQALALSNSGFALDMAVRINARLREQLGSASDAQFVAAAFEAVLASTPTHSEQAECLRALAELRRTLERHQQPDPGGRARGDLIQALINHNDFITVR